MTEEEIRAKYKALHDTLSADYYAGSSGLTKEDFDLQHGKIWNDMEAELIAEGYRTLPEPVRDAFAEIDELRQDNILLKAEIEKLKEVTSGT